MPEKNLILTKIPLGFIKAEFFRERAAAVREAQPSMGPVADLLNVALEQLRTDLNKADDADRFNEVILRYSRMTLEDWCVSLPDELPNSY